MALSRQSLSTCCFFKFIIHLDPQSMTDAECLMADGRIHCVFYFIAPHRMKLLDRDFITQLAPLVPIIPIIAKGEMSDSHNQFILTSHLS
jgi:septin family protein